MSDVFEKTSVQFAPGSEGLLAPLMPWLQDRQVSEILVNRPGEIFVENREGMQRFDLPVLDSLHLKRLFMLISAENAQVLNEGSPLLSGNLPDGSRVQLVIPPAAKHPALSIRRPSVAALSLEDYRQGIFYNNTEPFNRTEADRFLSESDRELLKLYQNRAWPDFIAEAIKARKNIIISGETSSGKTTFLNACCRHIPAHERIITLEDTFEVNLPHENQVNLRAPKVTEHAKVVLSMQDLVQCSLRLRPERIIMGEIRGREIMDFISACSTGHEGSITSIHASNPRIALLRMVQMYRLNNLPGMRDEDIERILHSVVDIILQLKKTSNGRELLFVYYKAGEDRT